MAADAAEAAEKAAHIVGLLPANNLTGPAIFELSLIHIFPGNDDAIRAVKLIAGAMADAVLEGKQGNQEAAPAEDAANA